MSILVAAATIVVFIPTLRNGFVNWDDPANLLENPDYRGLGWSHLKWMFTTFHMGHYHPISWLSLAIDYSIWGMNPLGYHLTSLLIHALNASLFYILGLRLMRSAVPGSAFPVRRSLCAAVAALFFSLHPLRVESVAWATERRDVLSGLFFLTTILCYLTASSSMGKRRLRWLAAALVSYALSLLSKAVGIGLPVVLLCLDAYPLRRFERTSKRDLLAEKIPFLILAGIAAGVAVLAGARTSKLMTLEAMGFPERFAMTMYGFVFYLWKTLLPFGLVPLYARPAQLSPFAWPYLPAALFVVGLSVLLVIMRKRWPAVLVVWMSYLIALAPLSGMFVNGPQIAADRYSYLSCLGWPLLAGGGVLSYYRRRRARAKTMFIPLLGLMAACIVMLGVLTWRQAAVWHDSLALWRAIYPLNTTSTLAQTNLASTCYNRGVELSGQGKIDEAAESYREAIRVYPGMWQAHQNLANILMDRHQPRQALWHYGTAVFLSAQHPLAVAGFMNALKACGLIYPHLPPGARMEGLSLNAAMKACRPR